MNTKEIKDGLIGGFSIIAVISVFGFIGTTFRKCQCELIKMSDEAPPYVSTDDDRFHREDCPFITEDNYGGEEFDSREEARNAGLTPCPHCLE